MPEVAIVGQFTVPARNRPFPLLRSAGPLDRVTGEFPYWILWDGEQEWRVRQLTEEQWDLPLDGTPSHPLFIDRIVSGWSPRGEDGRPWHVLYFPTELVAQVAAHRLRLQLHRQGFLDVDVRQAPPETVPPERQWLATAYGGEPPPAEWVAELTAELTAKSERELRAELVAADQATLAAEPEAPAEESPMRHVLYFPTEAAAERAATRLRAAGYAEIAVRPPESEYFEDETPPGTRPLGRDWQVLASGDMPPPGEPFGDTREHLEALAESLGGEYDGWEFAIRH